MARADEVTLEDVTLRFRNFAGREDQYNRAGDRNFVILLTDAMAEELERQGWNVKFLRARDEDEGGKPQPYLQVNVKFGDWPPRIIMMTSRGRTPMTEDTVDLLDVVEIDTVDVTLNPYHWNVGDKSGITAYLKTMYMKIIEDPLDIKWAEPQRPDEDD